MVQDTQLSASAASSARLAGKPFAGTHSRCFAYKCYTFKEREVSLYRILVLDLRFRFVSATTDQANDQPKARVEK